MNRGSSCGPGSPWERLSVASVSPAIRTSRSARLRAAFPAVWPGVWMTRGFLEDLGAVHLAEGVSEEFKADAVRVLEVDRGAARHLVFHACRVELAPQVFPLLLRDGDRDVVEVAQGLH